ncbi:MAG TPA: translational GTPase TypA, partial [Clostridiales bacterium]|nr:translational GTPase TypA [Clostridiales bacterium]
LLVDAAEGPMPQTRFVLQKALELGHKVIVAVNKIDKPDARVHEVMDEILELLLELDATDEQFNSPTVFCSGRQGTASYSPDEAGTDLKPLFETIINYIPAPGGDDTAPMQLLVSSIDYNDYVGRIAVGRVERGTIKVGQEVTICDYHDPGVRQRGKVVALYEFDGLAKNPIPEAHAGEIVALSGMADITIGRTLCAPDCVEPLPFVKISDPTIEMTFAVNDSPFAGKEGKFVTSRNLRDRLERELLKDVSLHVTEQGTDSFNVAGRGEMHLSILMETMRREGYEFSVSTPHVLTKTVDGKLCEPIERMVADVPEECMGSVIEKMGRRKGDLLGMTPMGSRYRLEFLVPSRGLFGYRNEFLTDTRGEGIMSSVLDSYAPMKGEIERRQVGSLIAFETGEAVTYGLAAAQERGTLFIGPGTPVYAGMVVGVCSRNEDMTVNVCKRKQLTNMRAAGSDEATRLTPPKIMSLEQCLEFLADDELLECTPKSLRIRKRELDHSIRMRNLMKKRAQEQG